MIFILAKSILYYFLCVRDMKSEYYENPHYLCDACSELDTLFHKPHNQVLLVLSYQGLTSIGPQLQGRIN